MRQRRVVGGQRKAYRENKRGGGMKSSVEIYLRREDRRSCGRRVGAKINNWMQNGKHDMPSTQLRKMQKGRSLLVLKTIKETSFVSPNKCVQKIRMQLERNVDEVMMVIFHLMRHQRS